MGFFSIFFLVGAIIVGSIGLTGGFLDASPSQSVIPTSAVAYVPVTVTAAPSQSLSNLQVNAVVLATVTPTPVPTAVPQPPAGAPQYVCAFGATCNAQGVQDGPPAGGQCAPGVTLYQPGTPGTTNTVPWCDAEPIIYLYPTKDTIVDVSLRVGGTIVESKPHYPTTGWNNILAHPNGTFDYQNKTYTELFYESEVAKAQAPKTGVIVPITMLHNTLQMIVTKLGLKESEANELVAYWTPILEKRNAPYIQIGVLDPNVKDAIDHVAITPRPDTFIQFNLYFKPVMNPYVIAPLQLPTSVIPRVGFTAVEWGGVIDTP